ncbi:MAG: glycerol-3-phosphate dehydrogenase/oxidase [Bacteroidetes bacterium]|nr:MAG: glycerol-3-phosphate dehydrogenase/oxidase [Bacteroidota bacterium]
MRLLSAFHRSELLDHLSGEEYDLLIIGGGATGSGVALDAASRGLKTALVEKQDFAAGTSSKSTKLIHGGLRYLKQFEIALVREVGRERAIVRRLAPHLVVPEKMLLPLIKGGTYGKLATSVGLMVYDVLAGVESADQRVMLSKEETLQKEPLLRQDLLEGAGYYAEYRTDDARLTLEVLKSAVKYGADCINYVEVTDFLYRENEKGEKVIAGAICHDHILGNTFQIWAKKVVSAAGPWADELRQKNESLQGKRLHLTKGVHIVLPYEKMPIRQSIYFDVPDGRMIFAIPRGKVTYVGTTDTDYFGDKNHPRTSIQDVTYLLGGVNNIFPSLDLKVKDVVSSWAGLRPLIHEEGKSASELSRKDEIFVSPTGLITIAGGKLTGYRKMAERTVDMVLKKLGRKVRKTRTHTISLCGGEFSGAQAVEAYKEDVLEVLRPHGLGPYYADYLVSNYGKQTDEILETFQENIDEQLEPEWAMVRAELDFAIHREMAHTLVDFFSRRTGRLYFDIESVKKWKTAVFEEMKKQFEWDEKRCKQELHWLEMAITEATEFTEETSAHPAPPMS